MKKRTVTGSLGLFHDEFARDKHVILCASLLEVIRARMGVRWWDWVPKTYNKWSREETDIASLLIRHCGESRDFMHTVDFITKAVRDALTTSLGEAPRTYAGHLKGEWFHHEHMTPGSWVLLWITDRGKVGEEEGLAAVLSHFNYRALLLKNDSIINGVEVKSEAKRLDTPQLKSLVPDPTTGLQGWDERQSLHQVPLKYHGLVRYEMAGLLEDLIPVSSRAKDTLADYVNYRRSMC